MNINLLQEKLLAAARVTPPSDRVPYAFEKRVLAHLVGRPVIDPLTLWVAALWRAALPCLAIMLLLFGWAAANPKPGEAAPAPAADLGSDLETTLLASVSFDNELSW
jgi:hypothetical protein